MRFRASNIPLLVGIVILFAGAIMGGVAIKNRAASDVLDDVERNSALLTDSLELVEVGESYVVTGDKVFLSAYGEAASNLDASLADLRQIEAGGDAQGLVADQATSVERLRQSFDAAVEDRTETGGPGDVNLQGERFAIFDEVVGLNSDTSKELGHTSLDSAKRRVDPTIALSILVLGALIIALGFTARAEDRRRRRNRRFSAGLQAARSEEEAYGLVSAHLERSLGGAKVYVFNRNNSADRLEPTTRINPDSELGQAVEGARPDDCLAIRTAKSSTGGTGADDLMHCEVCGKTSGRSLCVPSIVGGEVIGSVLVQREKRFNESTERAVTEAVSEAAPTVAHLRNLSMAERRAASDKLTGLPNKRSADDVFRQMFAQAHRTDSHLTLIMFDLDHFKRINDSYGHPKGDEVLAAIGSTVLGTIRENDFAARDGGEEFMALLPGTDQDGGLRVAEKLRAAIAAMRVPGVEQGITASFGVACFPDDATDRKELIRSADRALYAAKRAGRNRVRGVANVDDGEPATGDADRDRAFAPKPDTGANGSGDAADEALKG